MSKPVTHIIHKLNLEIDVPDERLARKMYQQAGSLLQQYVLPKLEELLKNLDHGDLHIKLDTLDINIDTLQTGSLEEVIKTQIAVAIKDKIAAAIKDDDKSGEKELIQTRTGHQQITDAFIWFIEHGHLPWWFADREILADSTAIIEAISNAEAKFVPAFKEILKANTSALNRLLLQYDAVLLTYLFSLLAPLEIFSEAAEGERHWLSIAENKLNTEELKLRYWQQVWLIFPVADLIQSSVGNFQLRLGKSIELLLSDILNIAEYDLSPLDQAASADEIINGIALPELVAKASQEEPKKDKIKDAELPAEGLLAAHAGLLLLHPFLQYFFTELQLLEGDSFRNDRCRERAVHILHYLATGRECTPDFNLLFEKYLCGMTTTDVTRRYTRLTSEMKTEAESMLASVIRHWAALKSTSADALRESFLQRKGKLIAVEGSHRIVMEQSSLDILLMRIPWNISLIKLPWLQHLIHVEWGI